MKKAKLSARAYRDALRLGQIWRDYAEHTEIFADELDEMLKLLGKDPLLGRVYPSRRKATVRWVLMKKCKNLVFHTTKDGVTQVITIWAARRGTRPKL